MSPTLTAFESSPDRGRGLARDMPVRWALEEVGQPYAVRLVSFTEMKEAPYRAFQPFGQIPSYQEGELILFESGAIVLHIASRRSGLLPEASDARSRAIAWMFCALSTMEPPILDLVIARLVEADKPWREARLPLVEERIRTRLADLALRLGDADWLDGPFSAGDLMMISVLRRVKLAGLLDPFSSLCAYVERGEARPAFQRAFAAQLAVFARASSAS